MADVAQKRSDQTNVRLPAEVMEAVERSITATSFRKPEGWRANWVQEAAMARAEAESGYLSGRMRAIVERYRVLMELELPKLTREEWELFVRATQEGLGWMQGNERLRPALLRVRLVDATKSESAPIVRRFDTWTYAQVLAVLDVCERHWAARLRGEEAPDPPAAEPEKTPTKKRGK